jgi:hypothetical protein
MVSTSSGVVFVVDGAGGSGFTPHVLRRSLSRLPYEVRHFRWGTGYGRILSDLTNRENIRQKASELSQSIAGYRRDDETRGNRVFVVAKSAGTAVALWALTELEPDTVDRAILLSPAVSPNFPLIRALPAVRNDLINFWSPNDIFFLGLGTSLFGTADGVYGKSAGLTGFASETCDDNAVIASEYAKLRQIKWEPSMIKFLHLGTHAGNSMPPFVDNYIVPLLQ